MHIRLRTDRGYKGGLGEGEYWSRWSRWGEGGGVGTCVVKHHQIFCKNCPTTLYYLVYSVLQALTENYSEGIIYTIQ